MSTLSSYILTMILLLQVNVKPSEANWDKSLYQNLFQDMGNLFQHLEKKTGDACRMNSQILDPRNIESTREKIIRCSDSFDSCSAFENNKYRTINGSCNNLKHPSWGKSGICYRRILPYDYGDKTSLPRISCTGKDLPNARKVSNDYHKQIPKNPDERTTHFMEWGQLVAHDLSFSPLIIDPEKYFKTGELIDCCAHGVRVDNTCMSFPVPLGETFYTQFGVTCMNYLRTQPCRLCESGTLYHHNINSAYHDLSAVYGSDEKTATELRSFNKGMLKANDSCESGPMPPTTSMEELCQSPPGEKRCYQAGDIRINQTPFLITVHTYMLRHHNFICKELSKLNPHWEDEKIYQESRRINIAQIQYITYSQYLPIVLGEFMKYDELGIVPGAEYTTYNPKMDASIIDEFAASAARYGHTTIPGTLSQIDINTNTIHKIRVRDHFYDPYNYQCEVFDKTAKGMTVDQEEKFDEFLTDDVRNFLYRRLYLNESYLFDLATLSVVRGRDHGIPGYVYYVAYFFKIYIKNFDDLKILLPEEAIKKLKKLYGSVYDIDMYSAGLAERQIPGGLVGPTFGAIILEQFKKTKFGDRYWFEHGNEAGSFTPGQLMEIKRSSLARILCDTTQMRNIQRNSFFPPSKSNSLVSCKKIHKFNFQLWKE